MLNHATNHTQNRSTQFDQINENCALIQIFGFLRKEKWKAELWKTKRNFTQTELKILRKITLNFGLPKVSFRIENLVNRKVRLNSRTAKRSAELYEKWISQSLFFNEENLENQRFVLNIRTAKLTKKYCGMKIDFFEILRKKEKKEF